VGVEPVDPHGHDRTVLSGVGLRPAWGETILPAILLDSRLGVGGGVTIASSRFSRVGGSDPERISSGMIRHPVWTVLR